MKKTAEVLLRHGLITQAVYDAEVAADVALEEYKTKGASLTKAQMQAILDKAVAAKAPKETAKAAKK